MASTTPSADPDASSPASASASPEAAGDLQRAGLTAAPGAGPKHPSLWETLRARGVLRVAASYVAIASLLVQLGSIVVPTYGLPPWIMAVLLTASIIGFPIAVALAWFLELTPAGVMVDVDSNLPWPRVQGLRRYADVLIIGVLGVAVAYLLVERQARPTTAAPSDVIAVLPFANLTGDPSQDHLSEGLSDTLIHFLSANGGLKVIARTSSFQFRGQDVDVREVGARLGAGAILEGSVQRSGDRLRVIAQLVSARDGRHYWSKTFDRSMGDIFAIQDEIAGGVLVALRSGAPLSTGEARVARPANLAAYEAYLLGKQRLARDENMEALHEALGYFERAIELDPGYASGYAAAAMTVRLLVRHEEVPRADGLARVETLVEHALALDPNLAMAHAVLGSLEGGRGRNAQAEAAFQRALELDPGDATALNEYANFLIVLRRLEEAEPLLRRAIELDPLSTGMRWRLASDVLYEQERHDDALRESLKSIEIDPSYSRAYWLVGSYFMVGQMADTVRWWRKAFEISPQDAINATLVARSERWYGEPARSDEIIDAEIERNPDSWFALFLQAERSHLQGDCAAVMAVAQHSWREHPNNTAMVGLEADCLMRADRDSDAVDLFRRYLPGLFSEPVEPNAVDDPIPALALASLLARRGDVGRARALIEAAQPAIQKGIRAGDAAFHELNAAAYAALQDRSGTLAALRRSIDAGWNSPSRRLLVFSTFDWLRDDPDFKALLEELDVGAERIRAELRSKPALTDEDIRLAIRWAHSGEPSPFPEQLRLGK